MASLDYSSNTDFVKSHWIDVTQKHINRAKRFKINKKNPLEIALKLKWKHIETVEFNEFSCLIKFIDWKKTTCKYFFPPKTSQFIRLFNNGKPVLPQSLEIRGRTASFSNPDNRNFEFRK